MRVQSSKNNENMWYVQTREEIEILSWKADAVLGAEAQ